MAYILALVVILCLGDFIAAQDPDSQEDCNKFTLTDCQHNPDDTFASDDIDLCYHQCQIRDKCHFFIFSNNKTCELYYYKLKDYVLGCGTFGQTKERDVMSCVDHSCWEYFHKDCEVVDNGGKEILFLDNLNKCKEACTYETTFTCEYLSYTKANKACKQHSSNEINQCKGLVVGKDAMNPKIANCKTWW